MKQKQKEEDLHYILKKHGIKYIEINEKDDKCIIPKNHQIAYISPNGTAILGNTEEKCSMHDKIAKIITENPNADFMKAPQSLIAKGYVMFGDISNEEKLSYIVFLNGHTTKQQHYSLKKIKEKCGYEYIKGSLTEEDLLNVLEKKEKINNNKDEKNNINYTEEDILTVL